MQLDRFLGALSILGLAACGSDPEDTLTCEYLASADNCWKTTAMAATSCLPPGSARGTLSMDNKTCTYTTGETVTFDEPLVLPVPNEMVWKFTIAKDGTQCLRYDESENPKGVTLTTSAGTVTETAPGSLSLSCPDGKTYSHSNPFALLSCPEGSLNNLPGNSHGSTDTSASFSLIGTGAGLGIELWSCTK